MARRVVAQSRAALACVLALALLAWPGAAQSPNSLPATLPEASASKIVITPAFGQCFTNGTTTFRSNLPVKWLLVPFDGDAPFYVAGQTQRQLTVVAGHRGGRLLVVAQAAACAAGSACAEQLTSPACAGVATGEITLAEAGAGVCSQAFSNASWTIVPWWKVVGMTVMLTSMGVLFALVVVARLRMTSFGDRPSELYAPASAFGAMPQPGSSSRLTMSIGGPGAPLFGARPDANA